MIFSLTSISKQFEVTFINNCLIFGNVNLETECFSIHSSEFKKFYNEIYSIVKNYKNYEKHYKVKTCFFRNLLKNHYYFWETVLENGLEQRYCINLKCEDLSSNELYFLILNEDSILRFLNCFRYFIFSPLLIHDTHKIWLKYCANLKNLADLYNNFQLIYQHAQQMQQNFNFQCDLFELVELFYCFYPIILVYNNVSFLIDNVNNF